MECQEKLLIAVAAAAVAVAVRSVAIGALTLATAARGGGLMCVTYWSLAHPYPCLMWIE